MNRSPAVNIRGIHHVALVVHDLAAARDFYVDALGLEVVDQAHFTPSPATDLLTELQGAECHMMMLRAPNLFLEVFEFSSPPAPAGDEPPLHRPGFTHLALEVEDVRAAHTALAEAGVRWHAEPVEMAEGYLMCYGRDPFGNVLEIQQTNLRSSTPFDDLPS